ncbi:MAG: hypothetical protein U0132_15800 [Gemmatimonadaceae bacterium]
MSSILALIALPLLAGAPRHHHTPAAAPDSSSMTVVLVQNDRSQPITVYAQDDIGEFKLGVVPPDSVLTLRVPDLMVGGSATIDFFIHPKGGNEQESGFIEVREGDRVGLVVPQ